MEPALLKALFYGREPYRTRLAVVVADRRHWATFVRFQNRANTFVMRNKSQNCNVPQKKKKITKRYYRITGIFFFITAGCSYRNGDVSRPYPSHPLPTNVCRG